LYTALAILYDQHRDKIPAAAVTWLLFCAAVVPQIDEGDSVGFVGGAALGVVLVAIGFLASSRTRTLPVRSTPRRAKMALASIGAGVLVGAVILAAQLALSTRDRGLHAQLARFAGEPIAEPLIRSYSAAVFEEVIVRLFAMSVIAWIAMRRGKTPDSAFRIALWTSAVLFALGHFPDPTLTGLMVLVFNGLGGVLLGWLFWRWGLPYAILCHFSGDVVIQSLGPRMVGA
jgi:membrane protease YdiL (CAAX protease family)